MNEIVNFKKNVVRLMESGDFILPATVGRQEFFNAVVVAISDNPEILQCDLVTVMKSLRVLASKGLIPDGTEAALVPFNTKVKGPDGKERWIKACQAMPMVWGEIKLIRNSGEVDSIWTEVVYKGEHVFQSQRNGERTFDHTDANGQPIDVMNRESGELIGVYCVAKMTNGNVEFEPMRRDEVEKVRAASKMANGPSWTKWYEQMARKSVIHRIAKRLPMSAVDRRYILSTETDQLAELGLQVNGLPEEDTATLPRPTERPIQQELIDTGEKEKEPAKAKAEPKAKATPKKQPEPEPEPEPDEADGAEPGDLIVSEAIAGLFEQIRDGYAEAGSADDIDAFNGMFEQELLMLANDFAEERAALESLEEAARKRLA